MTNIYAKLAAIQQELKAPKGQYNSFGKYKYRSCEDILEAVKPICGKNKTTLILTDAVREVSGRFYVVATATLADQESNGTVEVDAYAREPEEKKGMDDSQVTGTASSYARKYALNGLFCIDDTKDADTDEYTKQTEKKAERKPQSVKCAECGAPITGTTKRSGEPWSAADIVKYSTGRFGRALCCGCMKKSKAAEETYAAGNG